MSKDPAGRPPPDPADRTRRTWTGWAEGIRRRPFVALAGVTFAVTTALVVIVWTTGAVDSDVLWPELTKALISVLTVAVLGGIVKFLLDQHVTEREERKLETDFFLQSITDIEDIRRSIEHARLLIAAHRSARSYRDQMQNVIALRVRADELARRIQMHWDLQDVPLPRKVLDWFDGISKYLAALCLEYQQHYKPVSDVQRTDEAVVDEQIKQYAGAAAAGNDHLSDPPTFTWRAWTRLTDRSLFPCLNDFIDLGEGSRYVQVVKPQCLEIVNFLAGALRAARSSRPLTEATSPERGGTPAAESGATRPGPGSADVSSDARIRTG